MVEYVLDGARITSLETFYDEVSRVLIPGVEWGRNLDAFDDILRGGFGTPRQGLILRWLKSEVSKEHLGHPETARQLELRLNRCHPANRKTIQRELELAKRGAGTTLFEWLVEIIRCHGPGGEEAEDNICLILD